VLRLIARHTIGKRVTAMELPDLRPQLAYAQEWVSSLLENVTDDQWGDPTPCSEFDVSALTEHIFALEERLRRLGTIGHVDDAPERIPFATENVAAHLRSDAAAAMEPWADDARLTAMIRGPWGTSPGAVAIVIYVSEHLAHGWDLARATGQPSEADPAIAAPVLAMMQQNLPAEPRGGPIPFAPVVVPADDAHPTERLANWLGRPSR